MRKIGQRQARYYRKTYLELTKQIADQKNRWKQDWAPGWINIASVRLDPEEYAKIATARLLSHAVVVTADSGYVIKFYADKLDK
jgi:hypothetical protein